MMHIPVNQWKHFTCILTHTCVNEWRGDVSWYNDEWRCLGAGIHPLDNPLLCRSTYGLSIEGISACTLMHLKNRYIIKGILPIKLPLANMMLVYRSIKTCLRDELRTRARWMSGAGFLNSKRTSQCAGAPVFTRWNSITWPQYPVLFKNNDLD